MRSAYRTKRARETVRHCLNFRIRRQSLWKATVHFMIKSIANMLFEAFTLKRRLFVSDQLPMFMVRQADGGEMGRQSASRFAE